MGTWRGVKPHPSTPQHLRKLAFTRQEPAGFLLTEQWGSWNGHMTRREAAFIHTPTSQSARTHETRPCMFFYFLTTAEAMLCKSQDLAWITAGLVSRLLYPILSTEATYKLQLTSGSLWLVLRVTSPFWNRETGLNSSKLRFVWSWSLGDSPHCHTPTGINLDIWFLPRLSHSIQPRLRGWSADVCRMNLRVSTQVAQLLWHSFNWKFNRFNTSRCGI